MSIQLRSRTSYLLMLWREGLWGKWLGAIWAIMGVLVVWRDEIWQPQNAAQWRLIHLVPRLSLGWWLVGASTILLVWSFEASFRASRRLMQKIEVYELSSPRVRISGYLIEQTPEGDQLIRLHIQNHGPGVVFFPKFNVGSEARGKLLTAGEVEPLWDEFAKRALAVEPPRRGEAEMEEGADFYSSRPESVRVPKNAYAAYAGTKRAFEKAVSSRPAT